MTTACPYCGQAMASVTVEGVEIPVIGEPFEEIDDEVDEDEAAILLLEEEEAAHLVERMRQVQATRDVQ